MTCSRDFSDLDTLSTFLQEELMLETAVYDYYLETDVYMSRKEAQYIRRDIMDAVPGVYAYITENYDDYSVRIELED